MTVKEIEQLSGLTRANIRFYEAEGLLSPSRGENGYRDYSGSDLITLQRIKLLRTLGVSIDDIKALNSGSADMADILKNRIKHIEEELPSLYASRDICMSIIDSGTDYSQLDAGAYLKELEAAKSGLADVMSQDKVVSNISPARRYLARFLDRMLYSMLWMFIYGVIFRNMIFKAPIGSAWFALILMLFLEPLFLTLFGTTPGKALLGLSIRNADTEKKLSYAEAFGRTFSLMWYGLGFGIPIFSLIRMYKSLNADERGERLRWEEDSEQIQTVTGRWQWVLYPLALAGIIFFGSLSVHLSRIPANKGDLGIAQFAENYEQYNNVFEGGSDYKMGPDGKLTERHEQGIIVFNVEPAPEFRYVTENGVITTIIIDYYTERTGVLYSSGAVREAAQTILALAMRNRDAGFLGRAALEAADHILGHPFENYSFTACGLEISCETVLKNCLLQNGRPFPADNGKASPLSDIDCSISVKYVINLTP